MYAQVGEQSEGGVVPYQPLGVAQETAGKSEELNGDDRQCQGGLVRVFGGLGDEPCRGADEADVSSDRSGAQHRGQRSATPDRTGQTERSGDRCPAVHSWVAVGAVDVRGHGTTAGLRSTTRSASASSDARWATITTVLPCISRRTASKMPSSVRPSRLAVGS